MSPIKILLKIALSIIAVAALLILGFVGYLWMDYYVVTPSGIYSITEGDQAGMFIGMNKEEIHSFLLSRGFFGFAAYSPDTVRRYFHKPRSDSLPIDRHGVEFHLTFEIMASNYWYIYNVGGDNGDDDHVLFFRKGKLVRILTHHITFGNDLEGNTHFPMEKIVAGKTDEWLKKQKYHRVFYK